ncbi:MAG: RidA family protein [Burkholderiales bacterium]|nr:RidA family protein [Burkholderiales bacterium]
MARAKRNNIVSDRLYSRVVDGRALFPHAVSVEGKRLIMLSGQLAWDKAGELVGAGDMRAQFRQVCENLKEALAAAGAGLEDIVKSNTYVTSMEDFFKCVDIRHEYFGPGWPTSTTVEVSRLAVAGATVEIEVMAVVD